MRWIFFSLALFNLVAFAWGMVVSSNEPDNARPKNLRNPYANFPEIPLLSEVGSDESIAASVIERLDAEDLVPIESQNDGALQGKPPGSNGDDERLLCELVGPFETEDSAGVFVERLTAIEVAGSIRELELPAGPGYWVYLDPQSTRREALRLLSELQAKKIDSYVIPKGELANGISLGMFSRKTLSDARLKEMRSIGLEAKVEEIERTYREIWVMLQPEEGLKMSDLSWERVMEGINMLERRQNYCLDVASQ